MSLVDDAASYLESQSTRFTILSGTAGNLSKMIRLDQDHWPDTVVSLYETVGTGPVHTMSTSTGQVTVDHERPVLQVLSRSTDWTTARANAQECFDLLDGLSKNLPTSTGTRYRSIEAVQSPFLVERDRNDRFICAVSFDVQKEIT